MNSRNDISFNMDKQARQQIVQEIGKSFFVEASAGSGKTTMLVSRMVAMVEAGLDISKICAITFTKAAANEFYFRFQKELGKAAQKGDERAARALKDIDLCFMGTIDSFCNRILSEHPMEARVPVGCRILEKGEMLAEYEQAWLRLTRGEYPELYEQYRRWTSYDSRAKEHFLEALKFLMETRNTVLQNRLETGDANEVLAEEKQNLILLLTYLKEHRAEAMILSSEKDESDIFMWDDLDNIIKQFSDIDWESRMSSVGYSLTFQWNDKNKHIIKIRPEFYDKMAAALPFDPADYFQPYVTGGGKLKYYKLEFKNTKARLLTDNHRIATLMSLAKPMVSKLSEELRLQGKLSFFDYQLYLRDLLKKDAAGDGHLIRHIYERHSYFLIDEFQDTNPLQSEIFFYLAAEHPRENWKECLPRPGSLFIVGDPKQSIYRFRHADVVSYLGVKRLFEQGAGDVLCLTENFRSNRKLKEWYNEIFSQILGEGGETQSGYDPIPLGEDEAAGSGDGCLEGVYSYFCDNGSGAKEQETSPAKICSMIQKMVDRPEVCIRVKDEDDRLVLRRLAYKDFMIIPFTTSPMPDQMKAFRKHGIPFRIEGAVEFKECPAFRAMCHLMQALAESRNKADFIFEFMLRGETDSSASGEERKTENHVEQIKKRIRNMPPAAAYGYLLDSEKILERFGTDRLEYVYYAQELLRQGEAAGKITSLKQASDYLRSLLDKPAEERNMRLLPEVNAVHFANLHKIKGLEAPVVILVGSKAKVYEPSNGVDYRVTPPESRFFGFYESSGFSSYWSIKSDEFDIEPEKKLLQEEDKRKCYVAATRARNVLIIGQSKSGRGNVVDPWKDLQASRHPDILESVLAKISFEGEADEKGKAVLDESGLAKYKITPLLSGEVEKESLQKDIEAPTYSLTRPSTLKKAKRKRRADEGEAELTDREEEEKATDAESAVTEGQGKRNAHLIGTMVHRLMECLVLSEGKYADQGEALIRQVLAEHKAEADSYFRGILEEVLEKILGGGYEQPSGFPRDILAELRGAQEVHCELPFCYQEVKDGETILWHGIMDLVYQKDGKWYIIDYKTNRDNEDLDKDYESQLAQYKKAFKELSGEDAQTRIYSIPV